MDTVKKKKIKTNDKPKKKIARLRVGGKPMESIKLWTPEADRIEEGW